MTGKFGWEGFAFGFGPRAWGFRGRRSGGSRSVSARGPGDSGVAAAVAAASGSAPAT